MPKKKLLSKRVPKRAPKQKTSTRSWLGNKSKKQLIELILDIAHEYPRIHDRLANSENLDTGKIKPILDSVLSDIDALEPEWQENDPNEAENKLTDIEVQLSILLETGYADDVLKLGEKFLMNAAQCYEYYHYDDWAISLKITDCLDIILKSLNQSSLPPSGQLLWYIDAVENDNYSLFDDTQDITNKRIYTKAVWHELSIILEQRLQSQTPPGNNAPSSKTYKRESLSRWLEFAMEKGGRKSDVIDLLLREAPITKCYDKLVSALITEGSKQEARDWIQEGFSKTIDNRPGIAWRLAEQLRDIAKSEKNYFEITSLTALEFFYRPDIGQYRKLEKAAKKNRCWPTVRKGTLTFLETGQRPDLHSTEKDTKKDTNKSTWPVQSCNMNIPDCKITRGMFPNSGMLIEIAIYEKQPDEVLKWYHQAKTASLFHYMGRSVADAVKHTHPEEALSIWKKVVDQEIARVKVSAYRNAAPYLKKIRELLKREKRPKEWRSYLMTINISAASYRVLNSSSCLAGSSLRSSSDN